MRSSSDVYKTVSPTELREMFDYNEHTGEVFRRGPNGLMKRVGWQNNDGALRVDIRKRKILLHVVIWALMTGEWPSHRIDHHDRNRTNNTWGNLRQATQSQNMANSPKRSTNTSGLKRVSWSKRERKWQTHIQVRGVQKFLGLFDCPAAAHFTYQIAADREFGE